MLCFRPSLLLLFMARGSSPALSVSMGRDQSNRIALNDPACSRVHAHITSELCGKGEDGTVNPMDPTTPATATHGLEVRWRLFDDTSFNGTFLNEDRIFRGADALLEHGDCIRVGDSFFQFSQQ
jgi:pSer/pThr/pTyr-binding forkhead associated (FHA) protein